MADYFLDIAIELVPLRGHQSISLGPLGTHLAETYLTWFDAKSGTGFLASDMTGSFYEEEISQSIGNFFFECGDSSNIECVLDAFLLAHERFPQRVPLDMLRCAETLFSVESISNDFVDVENLFLVLSYEPGAAFKGCRTSYANTCSKYRSDGFGGGGSFLSRRLSWFENSESIGVTATKLDEALTDNNIDIATTIVYDRTSRFLKGITNPYQRQQIRRGLVAGLTRDLVEESCFGQKSIDMDIESDSLGDYDEQLQEELLTTVYED